MRPVQREEILDYVTYSERRDEIRRAVLAAKDLRRVSVGRYLTFLFENRDTVRYQVQEMIRAERIVKEADIRRELDTYNELLGGPGGFGVTLLVEIDEREERARLLPRWFQLPERIFLELEDGTRVAPRIDERQRDERRLSAVQFLQFDTEGRVPVALGVDWPEEGLVERTLLDPSQRAALALDLQNVGAEQNVGTEQNVGAERRGAPAER